jgi:LacI family transcriptional regulator
MRALADQQLAARTTVITSDLFGALVPLIQSGRIAATIDQRPWIQGQIAFRTIYRYLMEGVKPPPFVRLAPHVVMRSNLSLSLARMAAESAAHAADGDRQTGDVTADELALPTAAARVET